MKKITFCILCLFACYSFIATTSAHQPRLSDETNVTVEDPEISKAYYKELKGTPHMYTINSQEKFNLYVNILVPKIAWISKDIKVDIEKIWASRTLLDRFEGATYEWTEFFELFGYDTYLMWPEYTETADIGTYQITVYNESNTGKYSLAIGEIEAFDREETVNAYKTIPKLKREFFEKSPADFIFSPLGYGLVIVMFLLSFLFGFVYRRLMRRFFPATSRGVTKNIRSWGRRMRVWCWIILFVIAILTSWSPILLFASWFCFFEAIFSRCGFNALIGRNAC